jgi:LCP family protein required for cell wall assembly
VYGVLRGAVPFSGRRAVDHSLLSRELVKRRLAIFAFLLLVFPLVKAATWFFSAPGHDGAFARELEAPPRVDVAARPPASAVTREEAPPEAPRVTPGPAPKPTEKRSTPPLSDTDNYVLFGVDRRADGKGAPLADTILVLVLDRASGHVGLVSVPRDAYVDLGAAGPGRINTVLQVAKRLGERPLEFGKRVIEDTLGLPIRHALALDLGVFERAVDALGGVTVNVPCPIRDRFLDSREPSGYRVLDVDPGEVHMDGVTAALYVRSRHGRSDFSRSRRQQAVLLGLRAGLESAGGAARLPEIWDEFESSVSTDLKRYQLFDLARRVLAAGPERLHGLVINHPHVRALRTERGQAVLELDAEAVEKALGSLFSAPRPGEPPKGAVCPPKDIALTVRRGAGT